jgi:hypothetical protein
VGPVNGAGWRVRAEIPVAESPVAESPAGGGAEGAA